MSISIYQTPWVQDIQFFHPSIFPSIFFHQIFLRLSQFPIHFSPNPWILSSTCSRDGFSGHGVVSRADRSAAPRRSERADWGRWPTASRRLENAAASHGIFGGKNRRCLKGFWGIIEDFLVIFWWFLVDFDDFWRFLRIFEDFIRD